MAAHFVAFSPGAVQQLMAHPWPGNVRELRNTMLLAAATVTGEVVEAGDLHLVHAAPRRDPVATGGAIAMDAEVRDTSSAERSVRPVAEELARLEELRMAEALAACDGVQTRAAELIGMPLRTFTTKMKQYGLSAHSHKKTS